MFVKGLFYTEEQFEAIQKNYDGKAEYSNGAIILSSNTSIKHNRIISRLSAYLTKYLSNSKCDTYSGSIEVIFKNDTEVYKFKPDLFVMCDEATTQGESFTSAPKIIFEVISKSTASHDYITKLEVYQKFGVLEYNIVEQNGNIVQYSLVEGQFEINNTFKETDQYVSTVFPELRIPLYDVFKEKRN